MDKLFVNFLPPWVETNIQPAFYDKESGSVLQQTARMYAKVNCLVRMFNKLSKETKETVEDYIARFVALKDFVDTYFENLDVQEEINNKLDEMTEDGTLQEIIGDYLNATAVWGFDNVADMKASTNLISGSYAKTLGYYAKNDGGAGLYKIRTVTNQDVEDNGAIIPMDDNTLVAELIFDEVTTPEQFGAYGDGTHDDTTALQNALDKAKKVYLKGIYKVSSTININCSIDMDGDSYIKADNSLTTEVVHIASTHQVGNTYNVNVDASGVAALGIGVGSPRKSILNLNVINAGTVGISAATAGVYGNGGNEFKCIVVGNSSGTTTTGILINNFDSTFSTIVTQDCLHGVEINGGELIADCVHAWISNELASTLWANSAAVYFAGAYTAIINWLYQDSVKYGIKSNGGYGSVKYFEYNNTLTDAATLYNDYKNVSNSTKALRLTIDRFKNDFEEKQQLFYEGLTNGSKFGVTLQNGVPSDQASIQNYPTFTDCNDAPQFGGFYCKYDVTNLPNAVGGFLECKIVGNMAIQNFYRYDFASVNRVYYRCRTLGTDTWSNWFFLEPAA